jgi:hypothetical protein
MYKKDIGLRVKTKLKYLPNNHKKVLDVRYFIIISSISIHFIKTESFSLFNNKNRTKYSQFIITHTFHQ